MLRLFALLAVLCLAGSAPAVNIVLDYSHDSNNFFGAGNPSGAAAGAEAKATLEAAASFLTVMLEDSFSAIAPPPDFHSSTFNGVFTWDWAGQFFHPATGNLVTESIGNLAADEYRIYAGGGPFAGSTLAQGGPGAPNPSATPLVNQFTTAEVNQINTITNDYFDAAQYRGEPTGEFASWGGSIRFKNNGVNWNYDLDTPPSAGQNDFYSVALHELTHALGFGASTQWQAMSSSTTFFGTASRAANGGSYPVLNPEGSHWFEATQSTVYGGTATQEALMDPTLNVGQRKHFTLLDAAGLEDIGWEIVDPPAGLLGDYNADGIVNAADYTVWRNSFEDGGVATIGSYAEWSANYGATASSGASLSVPEPAAALLAAFTAVSTGLTARSRRR